MSIHHLDPADQFSLLDAGPKQHAKLECDFGRVPQLCRRRALSSELCLHHRAGTDRGVFFDDPVLTSQAPDFARRGRGCFQSVT